MTSLSARQCRRLEDVYIEESCQRGSHCRSVGLFRTTQSSGWPLYHWRRATDQTRLISFRATAGPQEVEAAVTAAEAAQPAWADLPGDERARLLRKWADLSEFATTATSSVAIYLSNASLLPAVRENVEAINEISSDTSVGNHLIPHSKMSLPCRKRFTRRRTAKLIN